MRNGGRARRAGDRRGGFAPRRRAGIRRRAADRGGSRPLPALPRARRENTMSEGSRSLIELRGITVAFAGRAALSDVSLEVSPGEIVTVIGPNGAGKTTLLRVALGLQRAEGGAVWRRPRLRVGYMPQRLAVDDTLPLTVARFLALVPQARRDPRAAL